MSYFIKMCKNCKHYSDNRCKFYNLTNVHEICEKWEEKIYNTEEKKEHEDVINHPKHYNMGNIEPIDVIIDWKLGYCLGNVVKYIARAEYKGNKIQDLKKAQWYLNKEIELLEIGEK